MCPPHPNPGQTKPSNDGYLKRRKLAPVGQVPPPHNPALDMEQEKSAKIMRSWQELHAGKRPLKRSFDSLEEEEDLCQDLQVKLRMPPPSIDLLNTAMGRTSPSTTINPFASNASKLDSNLDNTRFQDQSIVDEIRSGCSPSKASSAELVSGLELSPTQRE